ncbi:MAG: transcriptional regulator NrdR [Gammaproteobacteria bacterium]|nr:transcriptional regulator NrdR [Gammaproteobacteria bacterium]OUT95322.1 MAG: transcriptional regulator NrdR [Gammaproteobacteria bacterium TMED36]
MYCPFCGHQETKVVDSRLAGDGYQTRRRRECMECSERFTTYESAELLLPKLIKRDESREPFNESKLRSGILVATEKRPISSESIEELISRIIRKVQKLGEREIQSRILGEIVMLELREIDEIAFVRYASVYRRFQDIEEFEKEIESLRDTPSAADSRSQISIFQDEEES